jgi:hypothetical protein
MKVGDLVCQQYNGRPNEVGLVINIKHATHKADWVRDAEMVTILWCTGQEDRLHRRYRSRDLQVINEGR